MSGTQYTWVDRDEFYVSQALAAGDDHSKKYATYKYMNFLHQEILLIPFTWNCLFFDKFLYLIQAIQAMKLLTLRTIN